MPSARPAPPAPAVAVGNPEIAGFFRQLRGAVQASPEAIALRLGTSVKTIEDLENGVVSALPPWPETMRVVRAYCGLMRLDPVPLLQRLQQLIQQTATPEELAADRAAAAGPPPKVLRNGQSREPVLMEPLLDEPHGRGFRRFLMLASLPAALAVVAYVTVVAPAVGYRVISLLPPSLAAPAKDGLDAVVLYAAPSREGLKWIDIGDPRLRRGDKLHTKGR